MFECSINLQSHLAPIAMQQESTDPTPISETLSLNKMVGGVVLGTDA